MEDPTPTEKSFSMVVVILIVKDFERRGNAQMRHNKLEMGQKKGLIKHQPFFQMYLKLPQSV